MSLGYKPSEEEEQKQEYLARLENLMRRGIEEKDAMILADLSLKEEEKGKSLTGPNTYIRSRKEWRVYNRNKKLLLPK